MAIRAAIVEAGVVVKVIMLDNLEQWPGSVDANGHNVGDAYDEGTGIFTPPALPVVDPADIVAAKWEAIKVERDRRLLTGGYPVAGHWYHSDLISRSQHLSNARKADLVLAAAGDMDAQFMIGAYPMQVKSMDNGLMPMTPNVAHAIMAAAEMQELMTYGTALAHKAALEAAVDPAAYVFTSGWPAIYGDA